MPGCPPAAPACRPLRWLLPLLAILGGALSAAAVELPSFDDFFREVSECRLDMTRYREVVEPYREGVLISLPSAGAVRGLLFSAFYFSPARAGAPYRYGLLVNAPLDAVASAFPEFAARQTVNGHLRRLARLSEETGESGARRKTLLTCTAGTAV